MSNEDINKSIAEACGWTNIYDCLRYDSIRIIKGNSPTNWDTEVPDYCNDLNAMREAEEILASEEQCSIFARELAILVKGFAQEPFLGVSSYIWHATARQRAEAFLRTIGKWEEGKWEEIGKVEKIGQWEENK